MSLVALIRHAPTDWNAARRLQGRSDRPLSDAGRASLCRWRLPALLEHAAWTTSPLARARETAALLGHLDATVDDRLIEMNWGAWEGLTREELLAKAGTGVVDRNPLGRDFRPPGGETPREAALRVKPWIAERARCGATTAVTHRGVIRALYAEATGWDMIEAPPDDLLDGAAQLFLAREDGSLSLIRTNLMLA